MSRAATIKLQSTVIAIAVAVFAIGGGIWVAIANSPSHQVSVTTNAQNQTTYISYYGQNGQNALTLLKKHAEVKTKHYSFGDLVTTINGTEGNGPKYWTFYINGKEAQVGAGSYTTKDGDELSWKLQ